MATEPLPGKKEASDFRREPPTDGGLEARRAETHVSLFDESGGDVVTLMRGFAGLVTGGPLQLPAIPGYEPVRPFGIACGAVCATFYLARRASSGELVTMRVHKRSGADYLQHRDSQLARLDHPNILRVIEIGESQGLWFTAFEYVGENLADRLRKGPLSPSEVRKLISALALAVRYAWHQGMVASLAPIDVLLAAESVPKLCDFEPVQSVAKPGLPRFPQLAAPEEIRNGAGSGVATLVYSVGVVMYAALTGQLPFSEAGGLVETMVNILKEPPPLPRRVNPTVSRHLEAVCMKCLDKKPENRYTSLEELAEQMATPDPPATSSWSRLIRRFR